MMGMTETLNEFHGMLWGQKLIVYTDHKNLMSLVSNYWVITGKYRRILRFLVFLLRYGLYRGKDGIIVPVLRTLGSDRQVSDCREK